MRLHDPNFLSFAGEPITGRAPPQLFVEGGGELTQAQSAGVAHAYKLFRDALLVSVTPFLVQHRVLEDGTRVRMVSNNGLDQVFVIPGGGRKGAFALYPAFWYDAPTTAAAMPDPINSGTWSNLEYKAGVPLKPKEHFWKVHPGNRTWRDTRATSKTKGLVLSWWGLGRDNYSDWVRPSGAVTQDHHLLYCNGHLIADFGSTVAIMGACIVELDGVLKIAVTVSPKTTYVAFFGKTTTRYGGPFTVGGTDDWWGGWEFGALTMHTQHAKLPASFRTGFAFHKLDFAFVASAVISAGVGHSSFTIGLVPYNFFGLVSPAIAPCMGVKYNESGTEGVVPAGANYAYTVSAEDASTWVYAIKIDPRTGLLTSAMTTEVAPSPGAGGEDLARAWDYEQDELVWVKMTSVTEISHSKYGVLVSDASVADYKWLVTGDLRVGLTHLVGVAGPGPTPTRIYTFLKGVLLSTVDTAYGPTHNSFDSISDGFEGCDSSFDGRLIVDRCNAVTTVYVDGADVTTAIDDAKAQDIHYPVLCGPFAWSQGRFTTPPRGYVSGAP